MGINNSNIPTNVQREKFLRRILQEFDHELFKKFSKGENKLTLQDTQKLKSLQSKIRQNIFSEIEKSQSAVKFAKSRNSYKKEKNIVLKFTIVPFQFAARANAVEELAKPWRHDGGAVNFKLRLPHDKLEIFNTKGEYISAYPVAASGEVKVQDLDPGVYLLYLQGRKIVGMEFGGKD